MTEQPPVETERLDSNNPMHRNRIIRKNLRELASYLGVEFSGDAQMDIVLRGATEAVSEWFFDLIKETE